MTNVVVHSGACGFTVTIRAEKVSGGKINLTLESDCEMVKKMAGEITTLDRFAPLAGFQNNPVYQAAARNLKHVACPVPSGILKAIEVEAGINVPKDATIAFIKE